MKKRKKEKETTIENYYDLRTDKVDELVAILKDEPTANENKPLTTNISEITGEEAKAKPGSKKAEFDPYKTDKFSKIPVWIKALFIKWWFAGLMCYFVFMGLGTYVTDSLDQIVLGGTILGVLTDLMVNPIYRFMESDRKEYNNYMLLPFPFKAYWTFLVNIVYYIVVMFAVVYINAGFSILINLIAGREIDYVSGVGPLLLGVFAVIADMAFIGIKDLIVYLVKRGKRKKAAAGVSGADTTPPDTTGDIPAGSNTEAENVPSSEEPVDEVERLRLLAERQEQEEKPKRNKNKKDSK